MVGTPASSNVAVPTLPHFEWHKNNLSLAVKPAGAGQTAAPSQSRRRAAALQPASGLSLHQAAGRKHQIARAGGGLQAISIKIYVPSVEELLEIDIDLKDRVSSLRIDKSMLCQDVDPAIA